MERRRRAVEGCVHVRAGDVVGSPQYILRDAEKWAGWGSRGIGSLISHTCFSSKTEGQMFGWVLGTINPWDEGYEPLSYILLPLDSAASVHLSIHLADLVTIPPGLLDLYFLRGIGGWAPDVGLGCCLFTWVRISWIFLWASWGTWGKGQIRSQHTSLIASP